MADVEENNDETKLTKTNMQSIEKDTERLRILKEKSDSEDGANFNEDIDDLSKYTHEEDGVKVLIDTTSINRKAIFHDLDRLKHWRESMDQEKNADVHVIPEKSDKSEKQFEPIMEKNVDEILNQLPDVGGESRVVVDSDGMKRLEEIEGKLKRRYTLDGS